MSVLTDIFVASEEEVDELDIRRGPMGSSPRTAEPRFPVYEATSVDETVLATLEAMLTGRSYDEIAAELEVNIDDGPSVFEVGPALVTALAEMPDDAIPGSADEWARREAWFGLTGPDLEPLMRGLVGLARQARQANKDMWVWLSL